MFGERLPDSAVAMSLLTDHPNVRFRSCRDGIGACGAEMH
jgi:hypothetical protein